MKNFEIFIDQERPIAKGRPKVCIWAGKPHVYTPGKTAEAEKDIAEKINAKYNGEPFDGPLKLTVVAVFPVPKSYTKRAREECLDPKQKAHFVLVKPDGDNILKLVCDAIQKSSLIEDDKTIVAVECLKVYGERPGVHIALAQI